MPRPARIVNGWGSLFGSIALPAVLLVTALMTGCSDPADTDGDDTGGGGGYETIVTPPATPNVSEARRETRDERRETGSEVSGSGLSPLDSRLDSMPLSGRELVEAQIAAGELGPALETAKASDDEAERTELLRLVAAAQIEAGEFDAARVAIARIPIAEERAEARGEHGRQLTLAGGGSQADFQTLMTLIMQETNGPWFEQDGAGGTMSPFPSGVMVDPNGMLVRLSREELSGRLDALGIQSRQADLHEDIARPSTLRLVSLTRLEREVAERLADGKPVVESMRNLAGLSQIEYVFFYPEEGEVVIGGPAEGWQYDERGWPVGVAGGRPTLQLDDLVTVLRTFSPSGTQAFNCLIVPRKEGLRAAEQYAAASQARGPLSKGAVKGFVHQLEKKLGLQDVQVNGVPLDSRVARVIVEADYRMKLIGIDKAEAPTPSYFDVLPPEMQSSPPAPTALRWWLTMKYEALLHSPDRRVFQVQGASVQCLSENELITAQGDRVHTGQSDPANTLFAQNFTQNYDQIAEGDIIFSDLENVFDLSLVAALIHQERRERRFHPVLPAFEADGTYRTAKYPPMKTVETVANHRVYRGRHIVIQVAGGVQGDFMKVVADANVVRSSDRLSSVTDRGRAPELPHGRWWWDAAE